MANGSAAKGAKALTGSQKAAVLLLAMGKDNAQKLTPFLSPDEIATLMRAAKGLPGMEVRSLHGLVDEFCENYEHSGIAVASSELLGILNGGEGEEAHSDEPGPAREAPRKEPAEEALERFFESEPPVMAAILMTAIGEAKSAELLANLPPERRTAILQAFLNRRKLPTDIERSLAVDLLDSLSAFESGPGKEAEIAATAAMINLFDEEVAERALADIANTDPEAARQMRNAIFRFSMIDQLERTSLAVLFDSADTDTIVAALTGVEDNLKDMVLDVLSQRNRRMVEGELARNAIKEEKAEEARRNVARTALSLAKAGKLVLPSAEPAG